MTPPLQWPCATPFQVKSEKPRLAAKRGFSRLFAVLFYKLRYNQ